MTGIAVTDHGAVRQVTLNRPERRNAIDLDMRVVLAEALEGAMADGGVRAMVLTGAGGVFCAGGDVKSMARQSPEGARPRLVAFQRVMRAIWAGPKPVVAAVEGFAYGAGVGLAAGCDRVVAAEDARFNPTFTRVGLAGDMGVFHSLPRRIGRSRALQLLMLPEELDGRRAAELGLVDVVTAPGHALDTALADAQRLAAGPALALAAIKRHLSGPPRDPFEVLDAEIDTQCALFDTDDFAEGVAAFRERRSPEFNRGGPR